MNSRFVVKKMKVLRYIFIAAMTFFLGITVRAFIAPEIGFTLLSGVELSSSEIDSELYANAVASYRLASAPWLGLITLVLCGWIFFDTPKAVNSVVVGSIMLLAYIAFTSIDGLGYTPEQSVSAFLQGQGNPFFGWRWFHLFALAVLMGATWNGTKKVEEKDAKEAEEPLS